MATVLPADKFDTNTVFVRPDPLPSRAPLAKLAVLPGFNTRVKDDEYRERVAGIAESMVAHGYFEDKPLAVTMLPGDDTIYIFDGEHRFDGATAALLDGAEFPDGLPIAWAKDGATVKDLTIHLAHGNNGERLNMVELAAVVRRMQGLKMEKTEIAAALGRTGRHIDNLFVLAGATQAVKKAVASGQIAGAEAVKLLRKDPATAGAKIAEAVAKAAEKGKAKATPKTMNESDTPAAASRKTTTANGTMNFVTGQKMGDNLKGLAASIRELVTFDGDDLLLDDEVVIRFSVTKVDKEAEAAAAAARVEKERLANERQAAAEARQKEREEAAKVRAAEKAEAAKKREAEKAEAAKKRAAEQAELKKAAEAAKKAATAPVKPKGVADAKAAAQAHLSGDKAAAATKAPRSRKKAVQADSKPEGSEGAPATESAPSGQENPAPAPMSDESMGGL